MPISLLFTLMRHEWRILRKEVILVVSLLGFCFFLGGLNGAYQLQILNQSQAELAQKEQQRLGKEIAKARSEEAQFQSEGMPLTRYGKSARNPFKVAQKGSQALLPPGPLASLVLGQTDLQPLSTQISLTHVENLPRQEQLHHPLGLFLGQFDLGFVLIWLLPLFILGLSFDILATEQENGSLRMLLSMPISLQQLALGKICMRAIVLTEAIVIGLLLVSLGQGLDLRQPEILTRWLGLLGLTLLYGAGWFALALWVNSRKRPAATQATILALIWLAVLFVVPASLNLALSALYPLPSRVEFTQATAKASEKVRNASSQLLGKYFEDHPELSSSKRDEAEFNLLQLAKEDLIGQEITPVVTAFRAQLAKQRQVLQNLQFLSPALATQAAFNRLSGTGHERLEAYRNGVETHQKAWRDWFTPRIRDNLAVQVSDYARVPVYRWQEPAPSGDKLTGQYSLGLTAVYLALIVLLLGYRALKAYQNYQIVDS
jgi:ABC-2 type transport system permease protein